MHNISAFISGSVIYMFTDIATHTINLSSQYPSRRLFQVIANQNAEPIKLIQPIFKSQIQSNPIQMQSSWAAGYILLSRQNNTHLLSNIVLTMFWIIRHKDIVPTIQNMILMRCINLE